MAIFFIVKQPYGSADDVNVLANKTKTYFSSNLGYLIVLFFISIFFYHIIDSSSIFL